MREKLEALKLISDGSAAEKRRRGYAFEEFLKELLAAENLAPRIRFRPPGEELDGSFHLDGRTYLLEAKWHAKPLPASVIYAFKGKVDGKLAGTIGIFISMSGYSKDAIDALMAGKDLNVILMQEADVEASISSGFSHVLRVNLRAAAEEGAVFYPFTSTLSKVEGHAVTVNAEAATDEAELAQTENQLVIICEGYTDTRILNRFGQRILEEHSLSVNLRIVTAQGKQGIPRVANAIYPLLPRNTPLIVVVDGDRSSLETERTIKELVKVPADFIVIDPEIEVWFIPGSENPKEELRQMAHTTQQSFDTYVADRIETIPLLEIQASVPSFESFYNAILRAATPQEESDAQTGL